MFGICFLLVVGVMAPLDAVDMLPKAAGQLWLPGCWELTGLVFFVGRATFLLEAASSAASLARGSRKGCGIILVAVCVHLVHLCICACYC
jgi:hypothetical protein